MQRPRPIEEWATNPEGKLEKIDRRSNRTASIFAWIGFLPLAILLIGVMDVVLMTLSYQFIWWLSLPVTISLLPFVTLAAFLPPSFTSRPRVAAIILLCVWSILQLNLLIGDGFYPRWNHNLILFLGYIAVISGAALAISQKRPSPLEASGTVFLIFAHVGGLIFSALFFIGIVYECWQSGGLLATIIGLIFIPLTSIILPVRDAIHGSWELFGLAICVLIARYGFGLLGPFLLAKADKAL